MPCGERTQIPPALHTQASSKIVRILDRFFIGIPAPAGVTTVGVCDNGFFGLFQDIHLLSLPFPHSRELCCIRAGKMIYYKKRQRPHKETTYV